MQKMTARFTDEELMAYADGEVDEEHRLAIKAAAAADPEVARTIDMFAQTRIMARAAFLSVLHETPPTLAAMNSKGSKSYSGTRTHGVARMRSRRLPVFAAVVAAAACCIVSAAGLAGYVFGLRSGDDGGRIEVAGSSDGISEMLKTVPSGEQAVLENGATFQVISSFRDGNGRFCREFEIGNGTKNGSLAVACQADGQWVVQLALQTARNEAFKPASFTSVMDSYLSEIGAGVPMSASEERLLLELKADP